MPVKTWEFELDGARHNVVLDHSLFMGQRSVRVNGGLLFSGMQPGGSQHPFRIGAHVCEVVVEPHADTFAYSLLIDGAPHGPATLAHQPGEMQSQMQLMRWGVPLAAIALGIGAFFLNMYLSHANGYFYWALAVLTPMGGLFGIYMLFFPEDFIGPKSRISPGFLAVMFFGLLLGLVNWFALANGWY